MPSEAQPSLFTNPGIAGHSPGPLFGPLPIKRASRSNIRGKLFRRKIRQATPPWADKDLIRALYKEARRLTKLTGEQYTVDHIIPLKGETVCGLHVHYNLRVIPEYENRKKGNSIAEQLELLSGA